jgi:hypothetical protein
MYMLNKIISILTYPITVVSKLQRHRRFKKKIAEIEKEDPFIYD